MAKKLSGLEPWRLRNLQYFVLSSYCNFEDKVTDFEKDTFRKESLPFKQYFVCSVLSEFLLCL